MTSWLIIGYIVGTLSGMTLAYTWLRLRLSEGVVASTIQSLHQQNFIKLVPVGDGTYRMVEFKE